MSGTVTGIPTCRITATGIVAPSFADVLAYFTGVCQSIYGADVYLGNDSQDYQWIAAISAAYSDTCAMAVAVFNSFSPATAQGAGLSSVVKINGIAREVPSYSTANLVIVGSVGVTITNGVVQDTSGNNWLLPAVVDIPSAGQVIVTATAAKLGAVPAASGTINKITTPTLDWQSASNPAASVLGSPVETDAQLRQRQTTSTALPSLTVLDGLRGSLAEIPGVTRLSVVENDTAAVDTNGLPSHSICCVVEGGNAQTISDTILLKKGPGCGTFGNTTEVSIDPDGVPHSIMFSVPAEEAVNITVQLTALPGYTSATGVAIVAALTAYIAGLTIGQTVYWTRLYGPANLSIALGTTFDITGILTSFNAATPTTAGNLGILYNQVATPGNITVVAS